MKRTLLLGLLVAAVALAGCIGGGATDDGDAAPAETGGTGTGAGTGGSGSGGAGAYDLDNLEPQPIPNFFWFEYAISGPWTVTGSLEEVENYRIIFHTSSSGYFTATDNKEVLIQDLFWDIDPFLGGLDEGLNPLGDVYPKLYDWPLTDGKTWTSTGWDAEWSHVAHQRDAISTPMGTWPGYHIVATATVDDPNFGGEWRLLYDYIPGMFWFSNFMLHNGDGEMTINIDMVSHGPDYEGDMWVGEVDVKYDNLFAWDDHWGTTDLVPPKSFDVAEEDTHLVGALVRYGAVQGGALLGPENEVKEQFDPQVCNPNTFEGCSGWHWFRFDEPAAGTWQLAMEAVGVPTVFDGGVGAKIATMRITQMHE